MAGQSSQMTRQEVRSAISKVEMNKNGNSGGGKKGGNFTGKTTAKQ